MRLRCPSYSVDVDVDVNEFSHRLICTELLKENQVAPRDGSANAGRQPRNSIKSGRRPASRAQAYSQESTTTSTVTSTSTSTFMPVALELYWLFPYGAL